MDVVGAALIADISGSTALYETIGQQRAFEAIRARIERLQLETARAGGSFVHSKGDDILAYFPEADAALAAARRMVANLAGDLLAVHAGIGWGTMLQTPRDLFGEPVNTAAQLASLAKPAEVLISQTCHERLTPSGRAALQAIDVGRLKGTRSARMILSYVAEDRHEVTRLPAATMRGQAGRTRVTLRHGETALHLLEGKGLSLGRAEQNGLVVMAPWVSRRHATISLAGGLAEFRDHSSGGSYLTAADGSETVLRRSSITLSGQGVLALGAPRRDAGDAVVSFLVEIAPA